ncbi:helix-turn-helix domain-containing protein [Sphingopyxis sp. JAI128]|uniref:helix-turn-helix domain-containing protein n=1 Tax=Sphingopyxis sp. JAI128 TaxID=2723066 RepID=UPI0016173AC8|nr:helix-turn-helix domain-containing protein [Sphingopyxis sp. JAI128]MBB6425525.1 DNA-binding IclR family transcriptional regulator [Sphingopyxis sp. JAI128]
MTGPVRSVSQAFAILRLLADSRALALSDIARLVELSPSSCLNLLKTLIAEGAVEREEGKKRYRLAPAWLSKGILPESRAMRLIGRAGADMAHFAQSAEAAVGLWRIVSRDRMQLAAHAHSDAGMRLALADNQRQPLGAGAAGRAIAAAQAVDRAELERRFSQVRWQTALAFTDYARQVDEAAARGFSLDRGYAHRGVSTAGVATTEIAPGFCMTASCVAGSRSDSELETLGSTLAGLCRELVSHSA